MYILGFFQNAIVASTQKSSLPKQKLGHQLIFIFASLLGVLQLSPVAACTSLIVGKKATLDGKILIARSSDTIDARRAKNLKIYYDKQGLKSYLGLPYWDLERDEKNDMAQVATNQYGVSLSATQTIRSNPAVLVLDPSVETQQGITEKNIPNLIMPFAKTASDAIDILGKLIEQRGLRWHTGFGVLFADKNEAWYLETLTSHQWVAIKIPDDSYFVAANGPGQIQSYLPEQYQYKFSHYQGKTPIEFAREKGLAKTKAKPFNFRKTFADIYNPKNAKKNFVRLAYLQSHFNPSTLSFDIATINKGEFPMFLKPENKISVVKVQQLFASHYADYAEFNPYLHSNKDESQRAYYYPIANPNTSNAHLTLIDTVSDVNIAHLTYIALGMPTVSIYLPIYYGLNQLPNALTQATNQADSSKLFWQFRILQALVFFSDPKKDIPFNPQERIDFIQKNYELRVAEMEKERLIMLAHYQKDKNVILIDRFTNKIVDDLAKLNQKLIQILVKKLDLNKKYNLDNEQKRAVWFAEKVREQHCNYKPEHCR